MYNSQKLGKYENFTSCNPMNKMYNQLIKLSKLRQESHLGNYNEDSIMSPSSVYMKKHPLKKLNSNYNPFN